MSFAAELGDTLCMTYLARVLVAVCALALATGCSGTDVGNGRTRLNLRGYELPPGSSAQSLTLANGTRIDSLHVAIERVRLQPGNACENDDAQIDLDRVLVADLVGVGALNPPEQREWQTVGNTFCELRIDFHKLESGEAVPAGTPPELVDRTIRMVGVRQDGVPFLVESDMGERLELEAKNGTFTLPEAESFIILAFELSSWLNALDLGSLGSGPITVNKDVNQDRLELFEAAVRNSMRLFRDGDGNDDLSPDETTPGLELAD